MSIDLSFMLTRCSSEGREAGTHISIFANQVHAVEVVDSVTIVHCQDDIYRVKESRQYVIDKINQIMLIDLVNLVEREYKKLANQKGQSESFFTARYKDSKER